MKCLKVKKQMGNLAEAKDTSSLFPRFQEHLNQCAACREELQNVTESIHLLAQLPQITPGADFSEAWKNRIRQTSEPQTNSWMAFFTQPVLRPVLGGLMALVLGMAIYTIWVDKSAVQPLAMQKMTPSSMGDLRVAGKSGQIYDLKIVAVGPKSKEVQKLICNYRNVHEGGVALMMREPQEDWSVLNGLTMEEARQLQNKLEQVGAKVDIVAQK